MFFTVIVNVAGSRRVCRWHNAISNWDPLLDDWQNPGEHSANEFAAMESIEDVSDFVSLWLNLWKDRAAPA